jgi:hypothetical protein
VGVYIEASVVRIDTGDTLDRSIDGITSVRLEKVQHLAVLRPPLPT